MILRNRPSEGRKVLRNTHPKVGNHSEKNSPAGSLESENRQERIRVYIDRVDRSAEDIGPNF